MEGVTVEVYRSAEAAARGEVGGVLARAAPGGTELVEPMFSRADVANLSFGELPAVEPDEAIFEPLFSRGTPAWERFFGSRKVVRQQRADGEYEVVARALPEALQRVGKNSGPPRDGVKQYSVVQMLTDPHLALKFRLEGKLLNVVRNMAIADPEVAARKLQDHVRKFAGCERSCVTAGEYARSWRWASDSLKFFSSSKPLVSVTSEATIVGDKIFIYSPYDTNRWRVCGPLDNAPLVYAAHRLVADASPDSVMFAFGMEFTILDIDILVGERVLSPLRRCDLGDHDELPEFSSAYTTSILAQPGRERIARMSGEVLAVTVRGQDVASAVRISAKFVLVNTHVVDEIEGVFRVGGLEARPYRQLTRDLWLCSCEQESESTWAIRQPVIGELAVVCYKRHGSLQYTDPVEVTAADDTTVVLTRSPGILTGMSGGALVALSDFSLLGLHDGVTLSATVAAAFTPELFSDVCTADMQSVASHASAASGDLAAPLQRLKKRGLGKVAGSAVDSVVPVYTGRVQVGMACVVGSGVFTPCDAEDQTLEVGEERRTPVFERAGPYFRADGVGFSASGPMLWRTPAVREKVFVVGRDHEGAYLFWQDSVVLSVGLGGKTFVLSAGEEPHLPKVGGLVISPVDGAVLGVFRGESASVAYGRHGLCGAFPATQAVELGRPPEAVLMAVFPFLRPSVWGEKILQEVTFHSSMQAYPDGRPFNSGFQPLAGVGDVAMRLLAVSRMREQAVPTSSWQSFLQKDQSNNHLATVCTERGLHSLIRTREGCAVPPGSKGCADFVEALVGAVYLHETHEVFERFCEAIGVVRSFYELE